VFVASNELEVNCVTDSSIIVIKICSVIFSFKQHNFVGSKIAAFSDRYSTNYVA
jgi:hypothetical protein